ncbi:MULTISPECIES: sugar phosphate nucleotidyltransferase [Burkholderia]|uniref:sugar phosphate nucleotidyltransferase n=1 Tax=Burkholderia TaxID=32008 RepID=UPI001FC8E184|nr:MULTISPECIES: sugar phosphate nucleotidyltransferase [Burkholderia]MCU9954489.1 sugar phosphate nucleotidyltransferase [Burkholderia sp. BKH01]
MNAMLPCLILAGGLGTRLRPVLGDAMPKALASIDGEPFLCWMLRGLLQRGVTDVVLSLGYGSGPIKELVKSRSFGLAISVIEEDEPLGTGGAIVHAMKAHGATDMIVMNGDTLSNPDLRSLSAFYHATRPDLVVAAAQVDDASRYGTLDFDAVSRRLSAFREKRPARGYINAGTYVVNGRTLLGFDLPAKFSFEQDFLGERGAALDIRVFPEVTEFIDIGVPADYERAQTVIPLMLETGTSEA